MNSIAKFHSKFKGVCINSIVKNENENIIGDFLYQEKIMLIIVKAFL